MVSILHREMRIASRRRWTFWSRVVTTVIAFVSGLFLILVGSFQPGVSGAYLFTALLFVSFWFCLVQGVRRAAASISDEKRDGTLGLLFLTDLRPIDIIVGKLCAVAMPLIQPLLAFLPVLAISVLLGGITGGEIFRAALTLGSVLLFSISAGLVVSSVSRKSEETGQSTIFVLLAMLALPRWLAWGRFRPVRFLSPWSAYANIPDPGYRVNAEEFWYSLLIMNALSAALLFAAGFFLRRRWEDRPVLAVKRERVPIKKATIDAARRAKLLDRNPGEWLSARYAMSAWSRWLFIGMTVVLSALAAYVANEFPASGGRVFAIVILSLGSLLILIRLASQASFSLAEARRSGALEMLISTPLNPKCLISGQIASLRNQFLPPLGMLLIASFIIISASSGALELTGSIVSIGFFWGFLTLLTVTISAFGMWMGLREKSPNAAFFKTLAFTILPVLFSGCFLLWFLLPIGYIVLLLVSISKLTGGDLQRLIRSEGKLVELTPVMPIVPAPPVIRS
jgi:hypothetical protein